MEFEIRRDRTKPQGRKKLIRERAAYFQFMQQGYSNKEACRIVGIDVRTGKKWRNGDRSRGQGRRPHGTLNACGARWRVPPVRQPVSGFPW
ncbi:hypothetical protein OG369_37115 [Streptomyces sp. NBC_01221]|uniref:hypothetical protein n=1 Tax=unclassified Streptomyces TaxID=2593676 RepID=UPI002254AF3C|nr:MULTISPECIES: hypothetical protein [unclassified Streptomyces]WSP59720.1 hypothetical protein OG306_39395 [Streptomyces sp. NBC_01241]WSU19763.1 hypothetical protein OG508_00970 [Streptomyces sp. NBC_01108]MCX4791533.1 hypothetical protein [Streptomyces sp. NBC_01221]MCX4792764.1 hypothetical protein [Streptomyces sp. NBC_01242]WSP60689.1 hypothetical protein OG466_01055 [Streptomyces sp. NBC_01240]